MFSYNLSHTIFWNINLDKTCIAAWLVDLFPTGCLFISFGMAPKYVLEWTMGLLTAKRTNKQLFLRFSWIRCMNTMECFGWHVFPLSSLYSCSFCFWISLGDIFSVLQERVAAAQKFHSKEAEEEAKKVPVKTFTPGQLDAQDTINEVQAPKVVAPTPEQITAIKVHALSHNTMNTTCSYA